MCGPGNAAPVKCDDREAGGGDSRAGGPSSSNPGSGSLITLDQDKEAPAEELNPKGACTQSLRNPPREGNQDALHSHQL